MPEVASRPLPCPLTLLQLEVRAAMNHFIAESTHPDELKVACSPSLLHWDNSKSCALWKVTVLFVPPSQIFTHIAPLVAPRAPPIKAPRLWDPDPQLTL
jgi:hypothetical protein